MSLRVITQSTPNPNALKFIVAKDVKKSGKVTFTHPAECLHVPLATNILGLPNVTAVHLFENVVTVTQDGMGDWPLLESEVIEALKTCVPSHDPEFESFESDVDDTNWSDDRKKLEEILEREIRPGLQADGGDLRVLELDGNIVTVQYEGACGSCPSSRVGTLQGIESILRHEFHPDVQVVTV
ncbi:MAG: NifU family protein [Proteobacteria bacterium]|jgi:Fe-S cluster biogenesis protein NfuA|nr:NifU family protein [Pseudomonadota bacterium]